ncbi:MAG: hypothetical protein IJ043_04755 [Clostridia bacterium]|nr:hypothetical protein [Clostridia bacterium]
MKRFTALLLMLLLLLTGCNFSVNVTNNRQQPAEELAELDHDETPELISYSNGCWYTQLYNMETYMISASTDPEELNIIYASENYIMDLNSQGDYAVWCEYISDYRDGQEISMDCFFLYDRQKNEVRTIYEAELPDNWWSSPSIGFSNGQIYFFTHDSAENAAAIFSYDLSTSAVQRAYTLPFSFHEFYINTVIEPQNILIHTSYDEGEEHLWRYSTLSGTVYSVELPENMEILALSYDAERATYAFHYYDEDCIEYIAVCTDLSNLRNIMEVGGAFISQISCRDGHVYIAFEDGRSLFQSSVLTDYDYINRTAQEVSGIFAFTESENVLYGLGYSGTLDSDISLYRIF